MTVAEYDPVWYTGSFVNVHATEPVLPALAEWAFAPNWSLKSEYLYVNLGDNDFTAPGGQFSTHTETDFHTVRMGLNYRF